MRVYLNRTDLASEPGKQLLELTVRICTDGKLELEEIKELRRFLRANSDNQAVAAVGYLRGILDRVTADGVIDRDELLELQIAIERVIPNEHRSGVVKARKGREAVRRERKREIRRAEAEREKAERKRIQEEEYRQRMRLRHEFAKVAGVSFPNDNGTERQAIIGRCFAGEQLLLRHDAYNAHSFYAVQVLRTNGEQLGHVPEYLSERIFEEIANQYWVSGVLVEVTGGTWDKPTRGANFLILFTAQDVSATEYQQYVASALADRQAGRI